VTDLRPAVTGLAYSAEEVTPTNYAITKAIYSTSWDCDIVVHADGAGAISVTTQK